MYSNFLYLFIDRNYSNCFETTTSLRGVFFLDFLFRRHRGLNAKNFIVQPMDF